MEAMATAARQAAREPAAREAMATAARQAAREPAAS
jgi:hypothetical protein